MNKILYLLLLFLFILVLMLNLVCCDKIENMMEKKIIDRNLITRQLLGKNNNFEIENLCESIGIKTESKLVKTDSLGVYVNHFGEGELKSNKLIKERDINLVEVWLLESIITDMKLKNEEVIFIDFGSSFGYFGLNAAKLGADRVFIIEPFETNAKLICKSVLFNSGYKYQVEVFPYILEDIDVNKVFEKEICKVSDNQNKQVDCNVDSRYHVFKESSLVVPFSYFKYNVFNSFLNRPYNELHLLLFISEYTNPNIMHSVQSLIFDENIEHFFLESEFNWEIDPSMWIDQLTYNHQWNIFARGCTISYSDINDFSKFISLSKDNIYFFTKKPSDCIFI
eukprot:TRINITY_DN7941_c0_g1_i1.p1 TRINITY_DN7941_c0_g1~~TRINITY_DN7941_c0_g1_i1.p1  ORF type:complete len:338 (+),score=55.02 TRINITY_DN7941_c0_g1_i1:86-1099(+)